MIQRAAPLSRVERIGLMAGLVLAAALMWPLRGHVTDQVFVHLHHARHLAEGRGLVFNTGERVYGAMSPLWVALLADAIAVGIDGMLAAKAIGAVATLAAVGLFFQLIRRTVRSPEVRAVATVAWASNPWMLEWSMSGLEVPLAVALVLAGFVAFTEGEAWGSRPVRTGALWALAALTRPEAVLLLVLWGVLAIVDAHNRAGIRRLVFGSAAAGSIYGGWLLFARVYYGTFWPQILSSESLVSPAPQARWPNLVQQLQMLLASDLIPLAVLFAALAFRGRKWWAGRTSYALLQPALPWLWVVLLPTLYVARGVMAGTRHLVLVAPVLEWLAWRAAALWWFGSEAAPKRDRRAVALSVVLASVILARHVGTYAADVLPRVRRSSGEVERTLVHWGQWFRDYAPVGSVVAASEVGAIAYISRLRVIDTSGRVTPHAPPRGQWADASWLLATGLAPRPTFLVHHERLPFDLIRTSPARQCLTAIGDVEGWTVYRIDWQECDRIARARAERPQ